MRAMSGLLAIVLAACGSDDGGPGGGANAVGVQDFSFAPAAITVSGGDTVSWTWQGSAPHNVTFEDGQGSSATMTSGAHLRDFATAGTFRYRCTLHSADFGTGMVGSVVVQ